MSPIEAAAMLENHCDVGMMLVNSQGKVDDWVIKTRSWGYVLAFILDSAEEGLDRTYYADESQFLAYDTALMRAMIIIQAMKGLTEGNGE